jgi:hypothetical protein
MTSNLSICIQKNIYIFVLQKNGSQLVTLTLSAISDLTNQPDVATGDEIAGLSPNKYKFEDHPVYVALADNPA